MTDLANLSLSELLMRRNSLKRTLVAKPDLRSIRIAILGGSTTTELVKLLELWLLESGFQPTFLESEYGRFYVDAVHDTQAIVDFKPDVIYIHTSVLNLGQHAPLQATQAEFEEHLQAEVHRFREIWQSLEKKVGCLVIQNNFEFPVHAILGNLDATSLGGRTRFVAEVNREFSLAAEKNSRLLIQDVCSISARVGLENWFDRERWFAYKITTTLQGSRALAISLSSMIRAIYGKSRKVLVLDLDNTLWGGVIGDDGVDKIQIGRETPVAEAYTAFQEYCLSLRSRGILLAACSKNNEEIAKQGFEHPDSILKFEHFSSFKANWEPKHENIAQIARELNLGADSFVFVDDNPAEREIVLGQIDGIAVPNVGDDVATYSRVLDEGRYFEQISLSAEDIERAALYQENAKRAVFETKFEDYGEYLDSLEMVAEIEPFSLIYLQRIAQLTNKTNQFNVTTRRYTLAEMENIASDDKYIGLYGKLSDRFGDHGLISVVVGRQDADAMHLDLWLMSCRVLKRDVEVAMLDRLADRARLRGVKVVYGYYLPTAKNGMVADLYSRLGFSPEPASASMPEGATVWSLDLTQYIERNKHVKIKESIHE